MNDDFNTREGIAELFQLARISNNFNLSELDSDLLKSLVETFETYGHNVLGLFGSEIIEGSLEDEIESLIFERNSAREAKDWSKSDTIRDKLQEMGIEIQDTPDGTKWRLI
jgi:cysteinyl-tRNA synthetase